jgi:hypothetical protein
MNDLCSLCEYGAVAPECMHPHPETCSAWTGENVTVVVFRQWKASPHTSIALFPYIRGSDIGTCMSYEHIGQHGAASYQFCLRRTKPIDPPPDLLQELVSIGYTNLHIVKRVQHWRPKHA